jgi:hypothetical protein
MNSVVGSIEKGLRRDTNSAQIERRPEDHAGRANSTAHQPRRLVSHTAQFVERHVARASRLSVIRNGLAEQLIRIRDSCVLHKQVEAAKFLADALSQQKLSAGISMHDEKIFIEALVRFCAGG